MQQRLGTELENARLEYARQQLWEEDYSLEDCEGEGYEGGADEAPSAKADDCNNVRNMSVRSEGDVRREAAITALRSIRAIYP